jgi:hypothetical protein
MVVLVEGFGDCHQLWTPKRLQMRNWSHRGFAEFSPRFALPGIADEGYLKESKLQIWQAGLVS